MLAELPRKFCVNCTQKPRSEIRTGAWFVADGCNTPGDGLRLTLFEEFSATDAGGHPIVIAARKNRALLSVLALSPNATASRERLASLLWSDRGEEQARSSLRQSLAILRKELGDAAGRILHVRDDSITLTQQDVVVDALRFLTLSRHDSAASLREAAQLYRGELLADAAVRDPAFEGWLAAEQARFRRLIIEVLDRLIPMESGREKLAAAHRLIGLDPLREASHRLLMHTLAAQGETALALRQFESCQKLLRDELGVEPAAETVELRRQIVGGRPVPRDAPQLKAARGAAQTDKPTIAVLPFANLSGDAGQDFFSDGITEDIITELARFKSIYVIARNSSFAYRSRAIGIQAIARDLDAGYVLEGSVRRLGARLRITAQLSDATSGSQIWAERYDREVNDIFALQEELAGHIAATLALELDDRELERATVKRLENVRAYEHWLHGKRHLWTAKESNLEARRHFAKAVEVDPNFARVHAALAVTYMEEAVEFPPQDEFLAALAKGEASAKRALELDPSECLGHIALAWIYLYRHDYGRLKRHADIALRLNPNDSDMLGNATYVLALYGDAEAAVRAGETAIRLNPRYPDWYGAFLGTALFVARRHEDAVAIRMRAPEPFYDSRFFGAASLAHLGRLDEAREWAAIAMARLLKGVGQAEIDRHGAVQLLLRNNPMQRPEDREHFAEGMRKAGIPG
jgi:TolB-like protein